VPPAAGTEAQQLATWIGWKHHGWAGGLVAGGLFVIPGALVMLALSILYGFAADLAWFAALFLGIKAAVLAIIAQALVRIAGRALKTPFQRVLAVTAVCGAVPVRRAVPAVVVLTALSLGAWVGAREARTTRPNAARCGRRRPCAPLERDSQGSRRVAGDLGRTDAGGARVSRPRQRAVGHRRFPSHSWRW
jgi:chromate transporter